MDRPRGAVQRAALRQKQRQGRRIEGSTMKKWIAILAAGAMAILAIGIGAEPNQALPTFIDITKQAGITFKHSYGDHHLDNIVEGTGAGVCFFDYNGDGLMDLYFVTGTWTNNVSSNEGRDLRGKLSNKL